jgi:Protein of unknown function (DUF3574)
MTNILEIAALTSLMQLNSAYSSPKLSPNKTQALVQQDLYFGRNIGTAGKVKKSQFQQFINDIVTPEGLTGLTIYDAKGQFLDRNDNLVREPSQVVTLVYEDNISNQKAITRITNAYKQQFQQESVLQVKNKDIIVDRNEDLIDNDPTPELIQVDLYFGKNLASKNPISSIDPVSDREFRQFLQDVVTPHFPNGLTAYDNKVVSLILEDTEENERSLYQVMDAYENQFQQESVLPIVNEAVNVGFGQGEDLIDNDPIPQLIQVDLYYGQNIGTTGQVSDRQFRRFLRNEVTPRFPDGLTVYDADGQFLDSANQLIREPSKVVSLVIEDTQANERSMNEIIDIYKQKFQQESVLAVVDETLNITFGMDVIPMAIGNR